MAKTRRATLHNATAPVLGNGSRQLAALGDSRPDLLRKGYILMETGRSTQAIHVLNRTLYEAPRPPRDTTALALFLRSRAFEHRGDRVRAAEDAEKAKGMTRNLDLKRRCEATLHRLGHRPRPTKVATTATPRPAASANVAFIPRHTWNAAHARPKKMDPMRGIRRLTIHHSAVLSRSSDRAVVSQIRSIQRYHMGPQNRWGDIGYHFLIDPRGRIWEGRSLQYQGAHAGGANNHNNIGICLLGNFVVGRKGQPIAPAQLQSMIHLVSLLGQRYAIPADGVLTHRELTVTTCPGPRLQAAVNRMRRRLVGTSPPVVTAEPGLGAPGGSR